MSIDVVTGLEVRWKSEKSSWRSGTRTDFGFVHQGTEWRAESYRGTA